MDSAEYTPTHENGIVFVFGATRNYLLPFHVWSMSVRRTPLAITFLVAGVFLVAVAIPVIFSGVGGAPLTASPVGKPFPPGGTVIVLGYLGITFIGPAFFVGAGLLIVGIYLLRLSIRTLGVRINVRGTVPPEAHR